MRLAYVTETHPPEINGVSLTVARTIDHLRRNYHHVDVIRPSQRGEARGQDRHQWLTWGLPIPMYPDLRFGMALASTLRERFERKRVELVHVATPGPLGQVAVRAAKSAGLPVTVDFRTNFHEYSRYYGLSWLEPAIKRLMRSMHNAADLSFVPTESLRSALSADGFERLETVGRGVDTHRFSPQWRCGVQRAIWGAGPTTPVLLYVGRLAAEKQVDLAFRAWLQARSAMPTARMVVVGDGPLRKALERRWPNAIFTGMLTGDALSRAYASADVFLFPSESETFGNVSLEAMASGLAVVAFNAAAAAVVIQNGRDGVLVEPGDHHGFCHATFQLTAHLADMQAMRENARIRAGQLEWHEVLKTQFQQMKSLIDRAGEHHARNAIVA
jgi:glycosyltransferase involved in cell wall biosynthesis